MAPADDRAWPRELSRRWRRRALALLHVPHVLRRDHELDPLLAGLAEGVFVLVDVLLREGVDVLVVADYGMSERDAEVVIAAR
jgi:hypothetical protein